MVLKVICDSILLVVGDGIDVAEAAARGEGDSVGVPCGVDDSALGLVDRVPWVDFCGADVG